ncbi:MAG: dephospho-CoA kinase [Ignavibacteria bacterium]|nr:dephospho-CoA kinase [Ignavibacteria bacterium]
MAAASTSSRPPVLAGITGGFGSGKSTVASIIAERHPVLDSDAMARDITGTDTGVQAALRAAFGAEIFDAGGRPDRRSLASLVFTDAKKLRRLNSILHPPVLARIAGECARLAAEGRRLVFVESALIYEAGIEDTFDFILAVVADPALVARRADRTRFTDDDIRNRLAMQLPPEEKAGRADFAIRNDGGVDALRRNTLFVLTLIEALAKHRDAS